MDQSPMAADHSLGRSALKINDDALKEDLKWHLDTLSEEITLFKEMSEENCKFVKLTLARLLIAYDAMKSPENSLLQKRKHCEEALDLFDVLIKLDPSHKRYNEDEQSLVLLDQATSDRESLVKYCWQYDNPYFSTFRHHNCLQLSRLSLTRVGCVELMLWVQILDLSHNKLRSIAGNELLLK
ncbi:geranylgeranyl transferase type-2 subunit alpha 1-like isoform X2 [Ananas comosus]|uniref:Geranylgeranyl transferase type-2 subunit alpha 1-like isoform X2 n=1 Tax=Ananas comosus TaxID=4615 RepID=A0A6P5G0C5_ANACO|nr:geranylgeranyl transferase type-2 subunit alpha 1-like isoform X2 [Ananas comosus]